VEIDRPCLVPAFLVIQISTRLSRTSEKASGARQHINRVAVLRSDVRESAAAAPATSDWRS